jgi:hypothetical protein
MIGIKNCGDAAKVTEEDYRALNQAERKRLGQLVKVLRANDRITPENELRERAYYMVMADSIPFEKK